MIIFTDENMPPHLAPGFNILQQPESPKLGIPIEVVHCSDYSEYGEKDEDWIPKIGGLDACIITQDINITRRKHELALMKKHKVGIFFLKGKNKKSGMSVWEMVETLAKSWPLITQIAISENKPFGYEVLYKGKVKKVNL